MAIDHEAHKIRIKAVSDRMNHPMTYNDAGAPRMSAEDSMSSKAFDKKAKVKSLQDKMNRAPEYNRGIKNRNNPMGI